MTGLALPWPAAYALALAAGLASGFLNTVAGGGSLLSLPALILIGLPAGVANGTNRVAILLQSLVAARTFHGRGVGRPRRTLCLALPSCAGALLGAWFSVRLPPALFQRLIGGVLLLMLVVLLVRPERWIRGPSPASTRRGWVSVLVFFLLGVYGGFIQAGIGIFLLAALVLVEGEDLVQANGMKVGIVLAYTVVAVAVFARSGAIHWGLGAVVAVGSMAGAWWGARMTMARGAAWIYRMLLVAVAVSAAYLLAGSPRP